MPSIEDKEEGGWEEEEMDVEESERTAEDDDSDESGSDESSILDEAECEKRRAECMDGMHALERQFDDLKDQLFREREKDIELKLDEVKSGKASEYLNPLGQLQDDMHIRTQVAGILRELKLVSIKNKFEAELSAAYQHFSSEKSLLEDYVRNELEEKIRRLEEDRTNIDLSSDLMESQQSRHRPTRSRHLDRLDPFNYDRRRKPVSVSGPYIIYMLQEADILDDWTAIRKAIKQQQQVQCRRPGSRSSSARYDEGRLFYSGEWFRKNDRIVIESRDDEPELATITQINSSEVWVKRNDFTKTKLYVAQLQKGKYTMRHA